MGENRVASGRRGRAKQVGKGAKSAPAKSNRSLFVGVLAVVGLGGAAAIAYVVNRPEAPVVTPIDPTAEPLAPLGYLMGSDSAPVEVDEFGDFECPTCGLFSTLHEPDIRERLIQTGKIRFRFFDFPLPMHQNTLFAHNAAACAADQGKFWEMHDIIFQRQTRWNAEATRNPRGIFVTFARELGLNQDQFERCYDTRPHQAQIMANQAEGVRLQINATPTFIIGDKKLAEALTYDKMKAYVDSARMKMAAKAGGGR
jgi:protein-disulfide isomerase